MAWPPHSGRIRCSIPSMIKPPRQARGRPDLLRHGRRGGPAPGPARRFECGCRTRPGLFAEAGPPGDAPGAYGRTDLRGGCRGARVPSGDKGWAACRLVGPFSRRRQPVEVLVLIKGRWCAGPLLSGSPSALPLSATSSAGLRSRVRPGHGDEPPRQARERLPPGPAGRRPSSDHSRRRGDDDRVSSERGWRGVVPAPAEVAPRRGWRRGAGSRRPRARLQGSY